jgi:hypothetical protein
MESFYLKVSENLSPFYITYKEVSNLLRGYGTKKPKTETNGFFKTTALAFHSFFPENSGSEVFAFSEKSRSRLILLSF